MTYDEIQVVTQLASMAIFMGLMIGAFIYAFRSSNKKTFDHVAKSAIGLNDDSEKR